MHWVGVRVWWDLGQKLGQDHARRSPSQRESFVILMFVMLFRILPYTPFHFSSVFIRDDLGPPVPRLVTGGQVAPDCVTPEFTDLDRGLRKCGESQGEQSRATKRPRDREERERGGWGDLALGCQRRSFMKMLTSFWFNMREDFLSCVFPFYPFSPPPGNCCSVAQSPRSPLCSKMPGKRRNVQCSSWS